MPLATYPEAVADGAVQAAVAFAASLNSALHVTTFMVDLPGMSSGLGDLLIDIPGMVHTVEQKSKADCQRLHTVVRDAASGDREVECESRTVAWGAMLDVAATQARYYDLTLLPWSAETVSAQDLAQAVVFGSGRPAVLVPPSSAPAALDHLAIAWDGSRVAARALGDALPLLAEGGRISVLTIHGEKQLQRTDLAGTLAAALQLRGFSATPVEVPVGKGGVAEALQDAAVSSGARLLAMGGYGHSRLRDFVLGGATKGVLTQLRLPVLLSH
jgi:nucleotide-binding universal stress UspA family protein